MFAIPRFHALSMKALLLATLAVTVAAGPVRAEVPQFTYELILGGDKRMGTETFKMATLSDAPNSYQIDGQLRIDFSPFIFVNVKVSQVLREIWKNGQLATFQSQTNDRGDKYFVKAAAGPNGIDVQGSKADGKPFAPDAGPQSYLYLPLIVSRSEVFDPKDGERDKAKLVEQGKETVTFRGQEYPVTKYVDTRGDDKKDNDMELWYFDTGILYRKQYRTQGNTVSHTLK